MKVSELAKILKITPDTVRFYTRNGLLTPNKNNENGYKFYTSKDQKRLTFILSARQLGFSVSDITQILAEADQGHTACGLIRQIIEEKLIATEQQFRQTLALRNRLQLAISDWQHKPDQAPTGDMICYLIEDFDEEKHAADFSNANLSDLPLTKKEA